MTGRRSGHIVNIASIVGHTGHRDEAVYAATKGGLIAFGESVRYELEPLGVGVSLVTPGVVATPFFERRGVPYDRRRPRPVSAERVAAAVIRAIETGKAEIVVPPWLAIAPRVRGVAPAVFRRLTARLG
jgi:short-subunit dehydrogenase